MDDIPKIKRIIRAYFEAERICNSGLQGNLRRKRTQQKIKFRRWLIHWAKE